jgi:uncharacterized SAM-binding protein YcdF (DUF218 family)
VNELCTAVNTVAEFLALRSLPTLREDDLLADVGIPRANLLILLGNSLPCTAEMAASAFRDGMAEQFMIVGGIGHSTSLLRDNVKQSPSYQAIEVDGKTEADILAEVVAQAGVDRSQLLLETKSTNCGNNATYALELLNKLNRKPRNIILMQDPTMQRRTMASFEKAWMDADEQARFISFAPFVPRVKVQADELVLDAIEQLGEIWSMERFLSLLMGEIPRLMDDENGYGPKGKNFIVHVDIPMEVRSAYERLLGSYSSNVRGVTG